MPFEIESDHMFFVDDVLSNGNPLLDLTVEIRAPFELRRVNAPDALVSLCHLVPFPIQNHGVRRVASDEAVNVSRIVSVHLSLDYVFVGGHDFRACTYLI